MKLIPLTQGKFAQVDDADYDWLNKWKWTAKKGKNTFYAARTEYKKIGSVFLKKDVKMHRLIMGVIERKKFIDHEDRNGLNNQRFNLRLCNNAQNCWNIAKRSKSTSIYIGVSWDKRDMIWKSQMSLFGKKIYIGTYKNERDAAVAYNIAIEKERGSFAVLNIL